jgi:hypothetical protein
MLETNYVEAKHSRYFHVAAVANIIRQFPLEDFMKRRSIWLVLVMLVLGAFLLSDFEGQQTGVSKNISLPEVGVMHFRLASPLFGGGSEFSGMAWHDDDLILLPQYPEVFDSGGGDGYLFYIPKEMILDYLDGRDLEPLEGGPLRLVAPGLKEQIPNFQGFESIGFSGDRAFLTIEAGKGTDMHGYLISGVVSADLSKLILDTSRIVEIPLQAKSENHSDESILVLEDKVITFYEVLGEGVVTDPVAHAFDHDLQSLGTIPMTNLEYRLTDTAWVDENIFWGINYFFPGDTNLLPEVDPIYEKYGTGETHTQFDHVERLVAFEYSDQGIALADTAPIMFQLREDANNWEGLALLDDRGFLVVTDKYPTTVLGFVPFP